MKKIISIALSIIILFSTATYSLALEGQESIEPYVMPVTYTYEIPVTNYKQGANNWCGPASIVQTLSFHKSKSGKTASLPEQGDIAQSLGIYYSGGASSDDIAAKLNSTSYKTTYGYTKTYSATNLTDKSNPFDFMYNNFKTAIINQTSAPIILIETGTLTGIKRYYDAGVHCRHYVTISGIEELVNVQSDSIMSRYIRTTDPHYNSTFRGAHWDEASTVYQSMILADNNGTNKVMIY